MKKALFVSVLIMAVLAVNGYTVNNANQQEKPMRTTVAISDLPKAITDNIANDYTGYTIKEAASVTTNGNVTYEVVIAKGTTTETLVYDKDGTFLKKLSPTANKP